MPLSRPLECHRARLVASQGGGLDCVYGDGTNLTDCNIYDNLATVGGGLAISNAHLKTCKIYGNHASLSPNYHNSQLDEFRGDGGGGLVIRGAARLDDCDIFDNEATQVSMPGATFTAHSESVGASTDVPSVVADIYGRRRRLGCGGWRGQPEPLQPI